VDLSTKDKLSLIKRVKWLMADKDAFGKRISNVALVHSSLLSVITTLEPLPLNPDVKLISRPSHTTDALYDFPRSSYQRNAKRLALTIKITEFDEKTSTSSKCREINEQSSSLLTTELAGGRPRAVSEPPDLLEPSRSEDANITSPPESNEQPGKALVMVTPLANRLGEDLDRMLVKRMRRVAEMSKSPEPEPKRAKHSYQH